MDDHIEVEYHLHQRVEIKAIQQTGTVRAITQDMGGISYKVCYWFDGALRVEWLPGDELELRDK